MLNRRLPVCAGLALVLLLGGCRKSAPEPQKTVALELQADSAAGPGSAAAIAPSTANSETTLAEVPLPGAPSPGAAAAPSPPSEPGPPSVALHVSPHGDGKFGLPIAGTPATIRVTPIDDKGQPIHNLSLVAGARVTMLALRADLSWFNVQRATSLSDPQHYSHEFRVTFPSGGSHVVYFMFRRGDDAPSTVPAFLKVEGEVAAGAELPAQLLRYEGRDGLAVQLQLTTPKIEVCSEVRLGSTWLRRGRPLPLTPQLPDGARVHYVTIDSGLGSVTLADALPPPPMPALPPAASSSPTMPEPASAALPQLGDPGSERLVRFRQPGRYRVLAIAEVAGKVPQVWVAPFTLAVTGSAPAGGCPSELVQ